MAAMFASAIIYIFKDTEKITKGNIKRFRGSPVNSLWSKFKYLAKKSLFAMTLWWRQAKKPFEVWWRDICKQLYTVCITP